MTLPLGQGPYSALMASTDETWLTIGEFAALTGLTPKALRLYDKRDLLRPVSMDPDSGYRRYSGDQVGDGTLIAMLRAIDMPLAEIATVLAADPAERSGVVGRYWYRVERDLDEVRSVVRQLRRESQEEENGVSHSEQAVSRGLDEGPLGSIAALAAVADASDAADAYGQAMKSAYWEHHDVTLVTAIAYAGAGRLLAYAEDADDPDEAYEARSAVRGLMYDLASFSWPGWDEPGVTITAEAQAGGLSAARACLALTGELGMEELAVSRAQWMLGAHLLMAGSPVDAGAQFTLAGQAADRAGADAEVSLASAFDALAALVTGADGAEETLASALTALARADGGDMFVEQVETARRVLGR